MASSFAFGGLLSMLLFFLSPAEDIPTDALSLVRPGLGLEILGHEATDDSIGELISASSGGEAVSPVEETRELRSAIENLASRSEGIRASARDDLVGMGPGVLPRLRKLVAEDPRRADEASKVISRLEGQRVAGRHEAVMAQQLAIRLAAERKLTRWVPAIRKAVESENPFVRRAAREALARLDKTYRPEAETVEYSTGCLESLPRETRAILAVRLPDVAPGKEKGMTLDSYAKSMAEAIPGAEVEESDLREGHTVLVDWVRSYGNMRPQRVYLANVGGIRNSGAGLGIVIQGLFERPVLEGALETSPMFAAREIEGFTLWMSAVLRIVVLDDRTVLLLPVVASSHFPLDTYLADLRAGKRSMRREKRLARFLDTLADDVPVRGLAITDVTLLGELHAELRGFAPAAVSKAVEGMEDLSLTISETEGDKLRVRLEARFGEAEDAEVLAGVVRDGVSSAIRELEGVAETFPPLATVLDLMRAIRVSARERQAVLRLTTKRRGWEDLLGGMFGQVRAVQTIR